MGEHTPTVSNESIELDDSSSRPQPTYTLNVALLGFFFFLLFFAYNTTQNFETTLNDTLGFWSLSILYFFFSISNFISSNIVRRLGVKFALFVGGIGYTQFIVANIYPAPYILLPSSVVIGIGAAILWNAQGVFLAVSSTEKNIGMHSGMFFSLFQLNLIFGNLFAAVFLSFGWNTALLFVILSVVATIASFAFLLLRVPKPSSNSPLEDVKEPSILEVFKIFKNRTWQLLICISIYSGLTQSLNYGSFTSLIGNTQTIGYVMAVYGVADCLGSIANGTVSKYIGRRATIMIGSFSATVGYVLTVMIASSENLETNYIWLFYVSGIFLGMADAVFNTQLYAILGSFFPTDSEAIFAGFKMIQATSTAAAFFLFSIRTLPILSFDHICFPCNWISFDGCT